MSIRVMSIFGTRPEAIKMGPVVKAIEKTEGMESIVCVTAQHRSMLDQVLEVFDIQPDYDLNIMKEGQTLTQITTRALEGIESIMADAKPDIVLVHGDTTTTFAGALAAFYQQIKVGHVEAGLRTYNRYEPFPEEMNRKMTTSLADLHFAPTQTARMQLLKEGIDDSYIFVTGNTVIDALSTTISDDYNFSVDILNKLDFNNKRVITLTAHRRENLGQPLINICNAVKKIALEFDDVEIVYAVHLNPLVQKTAFDILGDTQNVHLLEPLELKDMHNLLNRSYLVLTDSGGLQEEVPSMGKPVLVLRNVTERPEGIEAGTLKLAGIEEENIYNMTKQLLTDKEEYSKMANAVNPYGDGLASGRIVEVIKNKLSNKES